MIIASHQPAYLPWLGYLDKIKSCDLFVISDSVSHNKTCFTNRNYVKTQHGKCYLTIPLRKWHAGEQITEIRIANQDWQARHLATIQATYAKAPEFRRLFPALTRLYSQHGLYLDDLVVDHLHFWLDWFGIERTIVRSKELPEMGCSSDRLLRICKHLGAETYLAGTVAAESYLDDAAFQAAGVELVVQRFEHPVYPQLHGDFVSHLGCVDAAMMGVDVAALPSASYTRTLAA